jgi:2-polyprenyl-6-hydroxyphenyl methylase/3-demethylubiquinone-9 3-methyltransferase
MLERSDLRDLNFLDIGSGSGLSSLAARSLGARVSSFDYDPQSVACTLALKQQYFKDDPAWQIEQGTVLDAAYLSQLGQFDIVYAWGMLHQTGAMWRAFDNIIPLVKDKGQLFISIYNDQGWKSRYWKWVKRWYNRHPAAKVSIIIAHLPLLAARIVVRTFSGRLKLERGMSLWHDYLDWLGGYPFEVARPEEILDFSRKRGLALHKLKTCGGRSGCNEYVFQKIA